MMILSLFDAVSIINTCFSLLIKKLIKKMIKKRA